MDTQFLERLRRIKDFVQARRARTELLGRGQYTAFDYDYRWKHTLRVVQYGRRIAEAENADVEIVMAACMLHDVSKFDNVEYGVEHGRVSARIARPFLETLGYTPEQVDHICFAVAVHVDDKADFEHPVTLETKIVNDADNVDRFGAYRILMQYRELVEEYDQLIAKAEKRIQTLKRYLVEEMGTPTGERLFKQQLNLQITFLERLVEDSKLTVEP
jgi:putative nucleotidyltransferase with HDIG domain